MPSDDAPASDAPLDDAPAAHAATAAAKLVRMANQIATFFASQPGDVQAAEVAGHIRAFWEPRMIRALLRHLDEGGEGLSPLARDGAERLRA